MGKSKQEEQVEALIRKVEDNWLKQKIDKLKEYWITQERKHGGIKK